MTKIDKILQEVEQFQTENPKEWRDASNLLGSVFYSKTAAGAKAKYESWTQLERAGATISDAAKTTLTRKKVLDALDLLVRLAGIVLESYARR